jgi:hypothetical protein
MTNQPNFGGGLLDLVGQLLGAAGAAAGAQPPAPSPADPGLGDLAGAIGGVGGGPMTQMLIAALGPTLAEKISEMFGIDKKTAMQVLMVAIPLLLAALARNAQNKRGADSLHGALERDHDGSALNNLSEVFANPRQHKGGKIVKKVLGNRATSVAQTLTEQTGVDGNQLLAVLAPVVLGALGQQQRKQGLDSGGLASALLQERSALQQSTGGLMDVLTELIGTRPRALS